MFSAAGLHSRTGAVVPASKPARKAKRWRIKDTYINYIIKYAMSPISRAGAQKKRRKRQGERNRFTHVIKFCTIPEHEGDISHKFLWGEVVHVAGFIKLAPDD